MKIFRTVDRLGTIYYKNERGQFHREDGPAVETTDGYKEWHLNGKVHREDGPAVELTDGDKWYYLNNKWFTKEDWEEEIAKLKLKRIKDL